MNTRNIGRSFEELVSALFELNGFHVSQHSPTRPSAGRADLVLTFRGKIKTVVEVRVLRSRTANMHDLQRTAASVLVAKTEEGADHALIVTNLPLRNVPLSDALPKGVDLMGLEDLLQMAASDAILMGKLLDLDRELVSALKDFDGPTTDATSERISLAIFKELSSEPMAPQSAAPIKKGAEIAKDLLSIPAGRKKNATTASGKSGAPWQLFETFCQAALEHAFEGVFSNWQRQKSVGGDANRFDILAKVVGDDVFCRTLIEDFRTRYVLFEFKNYSEQLKPNIIHVTEKYLYPTALRATAIIISPQGFAPDSVRATHGALRDVGKLILDMNRDVLAELATERDTGTNPGVRMEAMLDTFLQQVGR
jgi:hypothetical protein